MAFDFPSAPTTGQIYEGFVWNGVAWVRNPTGIPDAPFDGNVYARRNGKWELQAFNPVHRFKPTVNTTNAIFTIPAGATSMKLTGQHLPSILSSGLRAQVSTDGGATWSTTYQYGYVYQVGTALTGLANTPFASMILCPTADLASVAASPVMAQFTFGNATRYTRFQSVSTGYLSANGGSTTYVINGFGAMGIPTHIRIFSDSSGQFAPGTDFALEFMS